VRAFDNHSQGDIQMGSSIDMKLKRLTRALSCAGIAGAALTGAPALHAQQTAGTPPKVEKIEVTGSSIKRIDGETALPVTIITRDQIEKAGITSAAEFMDKLSVNNGQGYQASLAVGDAARPGFSGASLRGLGSNNTLVLLNGRRLAVYAFDGGGVNLAAIPLAAIERVEVLRDGASAVYGSDAIGGVINFITRKDFRGGEISAGASKPRASGAGGHTEYSATLGFGDLAAQKFNVFATFQSQDYERLRAIDRDFANTVVRPDLYTVFRFSSNSFPASISIPGVGLRSPAGPAYSGSTGLTCLPPASIGVSPSSFVCGYNYVSQIDLMPDSKRKSVLARGTFQLDGGTSFFAEYSHSENEHVFRSSQTPASEQTTFAGVPLLLYPNSPHYPTAWLQQFFPAVVGQPLNMYYRAIEAGPRTNRTEEKQDRFVAGVEGTIGNWDYSAAYSKAVSKADDFFAGGWLRESSILAAFEAGNINPFAPNTGAGLEALLGTQFIGLTRTSKSERQGFDFKGTGEVMRLPGGPLALAVGGELSKLKYNDNPQPVLSSGDIIGSGGNQLPVSGKRDVDALFAEASVPLSKTLEAQIALRHDRYSDFGNTTNPKFALRWQPTASTLVRAAAGKGFRAPTLANLYSQLQQSNTGGNYNDPLYDSSLPGNPTASRCAVQTDGRYCNAQLTVLQGGNPALQPEKSRQWTVGFVFEPFKTVSVSVDYWMIHQTDQIGILSSDFILTDYINNFDPVTRTSSSAFANGVTVINDPTVNTTVINRVVSAFDNLGEQRTKGVDVSVKAQLGTTGFGTFRLNFDGAYIDSLKQKLPGQSFQEVVGTFAQFGAVSRFKHTTGFIWDWRGFSTALNYNWVKGFVDENSPNVSDPNRRVGNYETVDLSTTYTGIKNLRATIGIRNLLDREPPASNQNLYFQIGYDPTYTDPRGRALFGNVNYAFK
jgi:iron complex outermembrane receptor protein